MGRGLMIFGWVLVILALLSILTPHVGFLSGLDFFSNLNIISHSASMIVAVFVALIGVILINMGCMKRKK